MITEQINTIIPIISWRFDPMAPHIIIIEIMKINVSIAIKHPDIIWIHILIFQNDFKYLLLMIYTNPSIVQETLIIHPCTYNLESVPELPGADTIKSVLLEEPDYISK